MPTPLQIKALRNVQNLKEFDGSTRKALLAAGYSQEMADNPRKVTHSKGFREMLDDALPDEEVKDLIHDLAHSAKLDHYIFPLQMEDEEIIAVVESIPGCKLKMIKHSQQAKFAYYWIPDGKTRTSTIDMVLKIRGQYAATKVKVEDPDKDLTNEELDSRISELQNEVQARKAPVPQLPETSQTVDNQSFEANEAI